MSDTMQPADYRRAVALTLHHRHHDATGICAIFDEAAQRPAQLLTAVLSLHQYATERFLTDDATRLLMDYIAALGEADPDPEAADFGRAARIIVHRHNRDAHAVGRELVAAGTDQARTNTLLAMLELYRGALPWLHGPAGQQWLSETSATLAGMEDAL